MSSEIIYRQDPDPRPLAVNEQDIEAEFIEKLRSLKYTDRPDIRDRASLEKNFREKFEALNRVRLTDAEFARLLAVRANDFLAEEPSPVPVKPRSPSERRQRRMDELPILETVRLEPPLEQRTAPDGTPLVVIREEVTDEVDYRPGVLFRRQIIRPVYASPSHAVSPVIAPLPARHIPALTNFAASA